jgi:hypothetical protein
MLVAFLLKSDTLAALRAAGGAAMLRIGLVFSVLLISACQTMPPAQEPLWVRTDGRPMTANTSLHRQGELDRTICWGRTQQAAAGIAPVYYSGLVGAIAAGAIVSQQQQALVDVMKGCMAERGYVLVPADQAAAVAANFRRGR